MTTLAHFSVSCAIQPAELGRRARQRRSPPIAAKRAFIAGSAIAALMS